MGLLNMKPGSQPEEETPAEDSQETGEEPQDSGGEESNVSPEEQKQYDTFMEKAADIIYGDKEGEVMPEILASLKPASEPAEDPAGGNPAVLALANTATQIVQKLDVASKEAGQQVSDDVLYHGGAEVIELLAEIAEAAGIHEYTEEEINGALIQAVDNYRPIAEEMGRTDADTLKKQFGEVVAADEQGKLGQVVPGLGQEEQSPAE